ncbi:glycosyltransferase [Tropicimonas sediminicola]|uniref:Glycosyltransferase involved in cell wall bisynthesis n=1 Tax=Tropicimonas sediminicola TaxID=1031541 RepID=A0A239JG48_9RHOB|nr:glycosyltransferase [Tropicimonas sediminicola]SNT04805.1 Glycosyltransferase involved in cell wall bisynthesis [Tropicimonas sediminicola]
MKILYYNWVDYLDDQKRGGGVSQYQRNLLTHLDQQGDVECLFLSSGLAHDLRNRKPRWSRATHGMAKDRHRRFEIVNSGCMSPSHHSFGHPAQVSDPATVETFADFVASQGPFDVIHFNNLEGIPAEVLELRKSLPGTRFVLSLHNYYPFCPQVNFWHRETAHCDDFNGGANCIDCLPFKPDPRMVRLANSASFTLQKGGIGPGTKLYDHGARPAMRAGIKAIRKLASARRRAAAAEAASAPQPAARDASQRAEAFRARRARFVSLINENCDAVLCVSDRVRQIAQAHGITPGLLHTSYIGSDHAALFTRTAPKETLLRPDGTAKMAYLGYMRRDKGFYFLLNALEALDDDLAARLHLVFAAAGRDPEALATFDRLRARFASLTWHDGYRHDEMDGILSDTDFGIVPVLWEDNLPQVAIEMHSRHIPLLTADRGGAQELGRHAGMVFRSEDIESLHGRLAEILDGKIDLQTYWAGAMTPVSLDAHIRELLGHYADAAHTSHSASG